MTAMQKAFEKYNFHPRDAEMNLAIAKYLNSGGTLNGIRALIDAAERMPGMDRPPSAPEGHGHDVQTRQTSEDGGGHEHDVQADQSTVASPSSSNRGGGDHGQNAQKSHAPSVPSVREPKTQRDAIDFGAASLAIKDKLARSVMDRIKIDGTAIGDYSPKRARIEGTKKTREGYILREAARIAFNIANPPSGATIRDLVKASEMESIEKAAEMLNDVA